jgi:hypothetical protein
MLALSENFFHILNLVKVDAGSQGYLNLKVISPLPLAGRG